MRPTLEAELPQRILRVHDHSSQSNVIVRHSPKTDSNSCNAVTSFSFSFPQAAFCEGFAPERKSVQFGFTEKQMANGRDRFQQSTLFKRFTVGSDSPPSTGRLHAQLERAALIQANTTFCCSLIYMVGSHNGPTVTAANLARIVLFFVRGGTWF